MSRCQFVGGLDIHRRKITFDYLDVAKGETSRGVVRHATREEFRSWLAEFGRKRCAFATEGTTGWRFVVEEINRGWRWPAPHAIEPDVAPTSPREDHGFQSGPPRLEP